MAFNYNDPKKMLVEIYNKTLARVDPCRIVRDAIKVKSGRIVIKDNIYKPKRILSIAFGKASCSMAAGVEEALGDFPLEGIAITKYGQGKPLSKTRVLEAGHPIPDENSILAAKEVISLLQNTDESDLVLFLISGGGSALLELPHPWMNLKELDQVIDCLLRSGATINEINTVRKRLSLVKSGNLAKIAFPSPFVSLIISDIMGSDISSVASGPTVADPTTYSDCEKIIKSYGLNNSLPQSVLNMIKMGVAGKIGETPKPGDPVFDNGQILVLSDNDLFCKTLCNEAEKIGLHAFHIVDKSTYGKMEDFISFINHTISNFEWIKGDSKLPFLLILGGELTIRIPDGVTGKGGRNQHLAMLFTRYCQAPHYQVSALFASTDGTDGPTDASGGFSNARALNIMERFPEKFNQAIENFDSYNYLKHIGELFATGPTGNNVNDVFMIYLP